MFCMKCGKEIIEGTRFCIHCGFPVDSDESPTISYPPKEESPTIRVDSPNGFSQANASAGSGYEDPVSETEDERSRYEDEIPTGADSFSQQPGVEPLRRDPAFDPVQNNYNYNQAQYANQNIFGNQNQHQGNSNQYTPDKSDSEDGKKSKIIVPIIISIIICLLAAVAVCAYAFNWLGISDKTNALLGKETTTQSDKDDSGITGNIDDGVSETTTTTTTTVPTEPTTPPTVPPTEPPVNTVGSENNPVVANGAPKNVSCHIDSAKQCTIKFSPSKTGYYYIQVPFGSQKISFNVYDGSGNLMGSSENRNSKKEYIFYDMFYVGQTYKITASAANEGDFKISFNDHTNDPKRVVKLNTPLKDISAPYTYLRSFTPTSTGSYKVTVSPINGAGTIKLYDANWNSIPITFVEDANGKGVCTMQFTANKKYNFVLEPTSTVTFSITK